MPCGLENAMSKPEHPVTPAVRLLRERKIRFEPHLYDYEEHGGAARAARLLKVSEHLVIKTLILETSQGNPLVVLMHGDREVSTKQLAWLLGVKAVEPCDVTRTRKLTGYSVGGISPFGTRRRLPVFVEQSILSLPRIYINGGKQGFLVEIDPRDLPSVLDVQPVNVAN